MPIAKNDSFNVKFYFTAGNDIVPQNDSVVFQQKFSNYYAYDDGSAEYGFGLESQNGLGNYKIAASYTLNVADTLRALDIFFDPEIDVSSVQNSPFHLMVWADNGGVPGNVIYGDTLVRNPYFAVHPTDSTVPAPHRENQFLRYQFPGAIPLAAGTVFYVGILQVYASPAIPIGFDRNTDFHHHMFYCVPNPPNADTWNVFPGDLDPDYQGSLMIHPVFGDSAETASIKKYNNNTLATIALYPNPAADYVFIQSDNIISKVVITDLLGNIVLQQTEHSVQKINTLSLPAGAYLVKAFTDKGFTNTQKLIISK